MELDKDFSSGLGGSFGVDLVLGGRDGGMCLTVGAAGGGLARLVGWVIGSNILDLSFKMLGDCSPEQLNSWCCESKLVDHTCHSRGQVTNGCCKVVRLI